MTNCERRKIIRRRYNLSLHNMSDYHINIFYSEPDGGYIADIPDLEACSAFGKTPSDALAEVEKAKTAWLDAAKAEGKPVPSVLSLLLLRVG